ncbi:Myosin 10A, isoform D [Rhizophlyctis rosea]|uniref:Myosin 10A, isoform D n=1 Tax=Rhizophlyctis rosea TaxID=64517 RepID=A0AAD5SK85_9FUNG|nr:Myosin 10A, isoform D [Rhizophlyctis rosea]
MTHEERRAAAKMFFEERYKQGAAVNAALGHDAGPAATRRFSSRSQSGVVVDDDVGAGDVEEDVRDSTTDSTAKTRPASWMHSVRSTPRQYTRTLTNDHFAEPSSNLTSSPSTQSLSSTTSTPTTHINPLSQPNIGGVLSSTKWYMVDIEPEDTNLEPTVAGHMEAPSQESGGKPRFIVDVDKLDKGEVKRQEVIYELLITEKEYVRDLNIIINLFMRQMRKKPAVDEHGIKRIFSNIELLVPYNKVLLDDLEQRRRQCWGVIQCIGDILDRVAQFFKMYTVYCGNQPEAMTYLKSQKTNSELTLCLKYCFLRPECRGLDINSFLLKPVQRICKYPLLLKELLKHTPPTHPDHELLTKAYNSINHVVDVVNERRRSVENQQRLLAVMQKLDFSEQKRPLTHVPYRTHVHEGSLIKLKLKHYAPHSTDSAPPMASESELSGTPPHSHAQSQSSTKHEKRKKHPGHGSPRFGVLFSDVFVLCKYPSVFSTSSKVIVRKVIDVKNISGIEERGDNPEIFTVLLSNSKHLHFTSPTPSETHVWIQKFREALRESEETERARPLSISGTPTPFSTASANRTSILKSPDESVETGKSVESISGLGMSSLDRPVGGEAGSPTLDNFPALSSSIIDDPQIASFLNGSSLAEAEAEEAANLKQQQPTRIAQPSSLTLAQRDAGLGGVPGAWTSRSDLLAEPTGDAGVKQKQEAGVKKVSKTPSAEHLAPVAGKVATRAETERMPGRWASSSSMTDTSSRPPFARRISASSVSSSSSDESDSSTVVQNPLTAPKPTTQSRFTAPTPPSAPSPSPASGLKKSSSIDSLREHNESTSAPSSPSLKARRTLRPASSFHIVPDTSAEVKQLPPPSISGSVTPQNDAVQVPSPTSVRSRIANFETRGDGKIAKGAPGVGWEGRRVSNR